MKTHSVMDGWQETKVKLQDRISFLYNNQALSDVTVFVGPEKKPFYGHKTILSAASPFFDKLFFGSLATGEGTVIFPTVDPLIFERLLQYIYNDEFHAEDDEDCWVQLEMAKMCLMTHLVHQCVLWILQHLNSSNVLVVFSRAFGIDERVLMDSAIRYFDWDAGNAMWTDEFLEIDAELLCTLLQRSTLRIKEYDLHDAVIRWSEAECLRQGLQPISQNQRAVLGPVFYFIRFPLLSPKELSCRAGLLTAEELELVQQKKSVFPSVPRCFAREKYKVRRFEHYGFTDDVPLDQLTDDGGTFDMTLRITSDRLVFLHALLAYGAFQDPSTSAVTTEVRVDVFRETGKTETRLATSTGHCVSQYPCPPDAVRLRFDDKEPIVMYPGVKYRLAIMGTISVYPMTQRVSSVLVRSCYGISNIPKVTIGNIQTGLANLVISGPSLPDYSPAVRDKYIVGQVPEIIFSV